MYCLPLRLWSWWPFTDIYWNNYVTSSHQRHTLSLSAGAWLRFASIVMGSASRGAVWIDQVLDDLPPTRPRCSSVRLGSHDPHKTTPFLLACCANSWCRVRCAAALCDGELQRHTPHRSACCDRWRQLVGCARVCLSPGMLPHIVSVTVFKSLAITIFSEKFVLLVF